MPQSEILNPFSRETLKQFLIKHYKHDRLYDRGEDYGDVVVDRRGLDLKRQGFDLISRFESVTGEAIYFRANSLGEIEECAVNYLRVKDEKTGKRMTQAQVLISPSSCDFNPPVSKNSYPCP